MDVEESDSAASVRELDTAMKEEVRKGMRERTGNEMWRKRKRDKRWRRGVQICVESFHFLCCWGRSCDEDPPVVCPTHSNQTECEKSSSADSWSVRRSEQHASLARLDLWFAVRAAQICMAWIQMWQICQINIHSVSSTAAELNRNNVRNTNSCYVTSKQQPDNVCSAEEEGVKS